MVSFRTLLLEFECLVSYLRSKVALISKIPQFFFPPPLFEPLYNTASPPQHPKGIFPSKQLIFFPFPVTFLELKPNVPLPSDKLIFYCPYVFKRFFPP